MIRCYDAALIAEAASTFLKHEDCDCIDWIADPNNIALVNDQGDMALFEIGLKHIYTGHYYFKSRGRQAIDAGHEFLDAIFNTCYNINVVMGLTPIDNRAARWMSRRLGFKSYGDQQIGDQHFEMFIITKKEFNQE